MANAFTVATFWPKYPRYDSNMPIEWVYKTADTQAQVKVDGYWNYATNPRLKEVKALDTILVYGGIVNGVATTVSLHVVLSVDTVNGTLVVSDGTTISVANT